VFTISKSQNLVPNNGFEQISTCNQFGTPNFYFNCLFDWINPSVGSPSGSPDILSTNGNNLSCSAPQNSAGYQHPNDGNFYAGLCPYMRNFLSTPDYKEYISVKLIDTLQLGKTYCFNMYVSLADFSKYLGNPLSVLFAPNDISVSNNAGPLPYIPQLDFNVPNDTSNWINLQSSFIATGGELYMTIGSFRDSANMQLTVANPQSSYKFCYFYIDDISLQEVNSSCTNNINEFANNFSIELYPNPTNDILNLKLLDAGKDVEIKITDVLGREVIVSEYKEQLDISQFEKGIYFLSVYKAHNLVGTKKIIKQ
jgi:OOP family OmpA-OmpF porin